MTNKVVVLTAPPRLLDKVRDAVRRKHYSRQTEEAYGQGIKRFVLYSVERGQDIRTARELLGHNSVETTMIYTRVMNKGGRGVTSPLDRIGFVPG
jgi:integrase